MNHVKDFRWNRGPLQAILKKKLSLVIITLHEGECFFAKGFRYISHCAIKNVSFLLPRRKLVVVALSNGFIIRLAVVK